MKKIITIAITLSLMLTAATFAVSAENITGDSGSTPLEVTVAQAYTVVIPDLIIIEEDDSTNIPNLDVTKLCIENSKNLMVNLQVSNLEGADVEDIDLTLTQFESKNLVFGNSNDVGAIENVADWSNVNAGIYAGTLTFTFSVE